MNAMRSPKDLLCLIMLVAWGLSPAFSLLAQNQPYTFPVNPGKKCYLTGSVGEIRRNHFHMGLDIAVNTGTPIYASADGFVFRVKASTYGYGRVLYIKHPKTKHQTVYGHLSSFNKEIGNFVRNKQYEEESYEVEIFPDSIALPVRKGQVIGYSGNSGGSGGPHLHYEIRTYDDITLDPMEFGFTELPRDLLPPVLRKIALTSLGIDGRVNGRFGRAEYSLTRTGKGQYRLNNVIPVYGSIGLEILTHDVIGGQFSIYGTSKIEVLVDEQKVYAHNLRRISHEYNLSMNVHVNYGVFRESFQGFQRCYVVDGNRFREIYEKIPGKGKIKILDNKIHQVKIIAQDPWGNVSRLEFKIKGTPPPAPKFVPDLSPSASRISHEVWENVLMIKGYRLKPGGDSAHLYFNGIKFPIPLNYKEGRNAVYLWDLQKGLPDYVEIAGKRHTFNLEMLIPSQTDFFYQRDQIKMYFSEETLFDTLYLSMNVDARRLRINNNNIPLYNNVKIHYSPESLPPNWQKSAMFYYGRSYQNSEWQDSSLVFYTRSLGNFELLPDLEAPNIELKSKSANIIRFAIWDPKSGIKRYRASLNGQFLLMVYDYKTRSLYSERKEADGPLKGNFVLEVTDKVGNKKVYKTTL